MVKIGFARYELALPVAPNPRLPPSWKFDRLKTVLPVEDNGTNFVSRTNFDKNWHIGS